MPAKSKAQQRFMGMVHAAQKGELDNPSSEVEKAADSMSDADAKDYASTKHKGLPNHVKKENMEKELKEIIRQTYRESLRESINEDAAELPQATIPSAVKVKLQMAIDKIKDSKLSNNAKLQLVAQVIDALDVDKSQLSNIANKIRSKMESVQMNEISSIDGLADVINGQTSRIEGMKLSKGMAEHIISWMNTSPYGKKYNSWVKKNSIAKILPIAFNWGLERGLPSNLKNEFVALKAKYSKKENESVNEAKIQPKDDWGVRLVAAINNNISGLYTSVIKDKEDITDSVSAFGTMLKNAIRETLKHTYKPHPKYPEADNKIKTFISELKKLEQLVNMVTTKPSKSGIIKLNDAWTTIWNHKYGAAIALSGDLFNSIVEGKLGEVKYPTDLKIGSVILGQGFTRLKGVDGGKYYKIVDMDDITATLVPSDKSGNVKGSSKVRHKLDSIEGGIKTAKRGDENGIVVIKESATLNKKVKSDLDSYLKDFKAGTPTHQWAVKEILKAALTDANFHSEAKKVDSMFSRANYEGDSNSEKSYQNAVERKGMEIANKAKWDGHEIIDAISFYTSMTIGHPLGQKVSSLKENFESVNEGKTYSNKFAAWFTGTVLNNVKHPTYGKHQLTADQIEKASGDYKNKLFKAIETAVKNGDITPDIIKKNESVNESIKYNNDGFVTQMINAAGKVVKDITLDGETFSLKGNKYISKKGGKDLHKSHFGINESVNETISHEAMGIASMTNTRKEAVQKFIDDNNLNAKEILNHVTKGKLPERIRFVQALVGTPNNSSFKWYVKNYTNESVNEGKKVFKVNPGIGSSKYSISSHDGVKKHKDGSDFYDIEIFKNKVDLEKGIKKYSSNGFIQESLIKEDVYKTILSNDKGKMFFSLVDDETRDVKFLDAVTWIKSTIKDKASDSSKELVLAALVRQINQFNRKVEYNMWVNANKPTWEEKIKHLLDKRLVNNVNRGGIKVH